MLMTNQSTANVDRQGQSGSYPIEKKSVSCFGRFTGRITQLVGWEAVSRKLTFLWNSIHWQTADNFIVQAPTRAITDHQLAVELNIDPTNERITTLLTVHEAIQPEPGTLGALKLSYAIGMRAGLGLPQHRDDYNAFLEVDGEDSEARHIVNQAVTFSAVIACIPVSLQATDLPQEEDTAEEYAGVMPTRPELDTVLRCAIQIAALSPPNNQKMSQEQLSKAVKLLDGCDDRACSAIVQHIQDMSCLQKLVDDFLGPPRKTEGKLRPYELDATYLDALAGIHRVLGSEQPSWFPQWIEQLKDEAFPAPFVADLFMGEIWLGRSGLQEDRHKPPPARTLKTTLAWLKGRSAHPSTMGRFLSACVAHKFIPASQVQASGDPFPQSWGFRGEYSSRGASGGVGGISCYSLLTAYVAYSRRHLLACPQGFSSYLDQLEKRAGSEGLIRGVQQVAALIESGEIDGCSREALALPDRLRHEFDGDSSLVANLCRALVALGMAQGQQLQAKYAISTNTEKNTRRSKSAPVSIASWMAQAAITKATARETAFWRNGATLLAEVEARCIEINVGLPSGLRQDIPLFMGTHEAAVLSLVWVVGEEEARRHLDYYLNLKGLGPLQRFLSVQKVPTASDVVILRQLYGRLAPTKRGGKALKVRSEHWQRLLALHSAFAQTGASKRFRSVLVEVSKAEDPLSLVCDLERRGSHALMDEFKKRLNIQDQLAGDAGEISTEHLLVVAKELPLLLQGRSFLGGFPTVYREIFDALSLRMIRGDTPEVIVAFLTDKEQGDELGQAIAEHNASISTRLKELGVDFDTYWSGISPQSFSVKEAAENPQSMLASKIRAVSSTLATLPPLVEEYVQAVASGDNDALERQVDGVSNLVRKALLGLGLTDTADVATESYHERVAKRLQNAATVGQLLGKLEKAYKTATLIDADVTVRSARSGQRNLTEFVGHTRDAVTQLQNTSNISGKRVRSAKTIRGPFQVRIWKRDPLHCLGIGKRVNCCLSPDSNSQFQALIERYIDAALNVVEVVDKDGVTVSLAWLLLAENKEGDTGQGADLVINFLEMAPNVRGDSVTRDRILHELCEYTKRFAKSVGARRCLARTQEYGELPDHVAPMVEVSLHKVGDTLLGKPYYLEAENCSSLHLLWQGETPSPKLL
jgi:hypothetical protein